MSIVNFGLLKHPLNWLTIFLMLMIAAMAGSLILSGMGIEPDTRQ